MREKVKDRGRLEHILEAINEIQEYKSQYTLEDVKNSKLVFYGFTKFVEVIGEAVYMLTKEFRASHPEVDWRVIEKMRVLLKFWYIYVSKFEETFICKREIDALPPIIRFAVFILLTEPSRIPLFNLLAIELLMAE